MLSRTLARCYRPLSPIAGSRVFAVKVVVFKGVNGDKQTTRQTIIVCHCDFISMLAIFRPVVLIGISAISASESH